MDLRQIGQLAGVGVSVVEDGKESECALRGNHAGALLTYFMMDVAHDPARYRDFDCYAFASLLSDSAFMPAEPPFAFDPGAAQAGDIVVAADGAELPSSIRHWALCLGRGLFISKLGQTGHGAQALLEITDEGGMLSLYGCDRLFVASRTPDAPPWNGARWPVR